MLIIYIPHMIPIMSSMCEWIPELFCTQNSAWYPWVELSQMVPVYHGYQVTHCIMHLVQQSSEQY